MATNEELFQEWQGGKADALATLVQRYHAPLVAHFFRLLGDAHLAQDLAQDTFFRLVRAEVLGVPVGTVKSRTRAALRLLRTYLEPTARKPTERRS